MTECDRHQRQQQAFEEELFPNLVMPERILKKLTTEVSYNFLSSLPPSLSQPLLRGRVVHFTKALPHEIMFTCWAY